MESCKAPYFCGMCRDVSTSAHPVEVWRGSGERGHWVILKHDLLSRNSSISLKATLAQSITLKKSFPAKAQMVCCENTGVSMSTWNCTPRSQSHFHIHIVVRILGIN